MISILLPDLRGGGAERVCLDLAHVFAGAGHQVEFVLMRDKGELLDEARARFPVLSLGCSRMRGLAPVLARYIRRAQPDVLLAAMWPLTVVAPFAQRISGRNTRVVVSEHAMLSAQYHDWGRFHRRLLIASTAAGYRLASRRIGVSHGVVRDMARLSGLSECRFDVIHNPIPVRPLPQSKVMQEADHLWSVPRGSRILSVGKLKAVKSHSVLIKAFARLARPDARLMLVGDGPERDRLVTLARDLGIARRVIFAGFQPDPTPFYRTADLFVLSSDHEGFGNVIVEALSCGLAVVSTDCPSGPREILDGGKYGRLVPVGDADALTTAIRETLVSSVNGDMLRQRAADFSPEIAARKYLEVMELS